MDERIAEVIAKLKADSNGLAFTGFISNAYVTHPSVLDGEIWCHAHAESSAKFSDGQRIQTSWIIEINACGESIWVETQNGSRYGIVSFAPLGWVYFSNLRRAHDRLVSAPIGPPVFDLPAQHHRQGQPISTALGKLAERRIERQGLESESKARGLKPARPKTSPDYMIRVAENARESIEALKRNGVNVIKHDE
ncbi:hypothetical protein [Pseudomonas sp. UMAB-40]|uniref:hypothetical protein n=1 Tax=Pseudomonas sp. UMAB-40 TaxID=1365407 RepID=UPI001C59934F|nr:hypothetical protein [Pseudomonas sp. UMAB-40]